MFEFKYVFPETKTPFNNEILEKRLVDLKYKNLFEPLFTELSCENSDHEEYINKVTIHLKEPYSFVTDDVCCADFQKKIKKKLMKH